MFKYATIKLALDIYARNDLQKILKDKKKYYTEVLIIKLKLLELSKLQRCWAKIEL